MPTVNAALKEDVPELVNLWAPKHLLELVLPVPASTIRPDKFRSVAPPEEQEARTSKSKVLLERS